MTKKYIDINCDVAEGIGNEDVLFPLISSCNIACGEHAGDLETMKNVAALARRHGLKTGGHPSYPDRENFGRISMKIPADDLISSIRAQLNKLVVVLKEEGLSLYHIKPHGALYNDVAKNPDLAALFLDAIVKYKKVAVLYVPPSSEIEQLAEKEGFNIYFEVFGDRNYNNDLSLVSRKLDNALITKPETVLDHVARMVREEEVKTVDGVLKKIKADTVCIHGDTPTAVQILKHLASELHKYNIHIKK